MRHKVASRVKMPKGRTGTEVAHIGTKATFLKSHLNFLLPFDFIQYFLKSRPCENSQADFCTSGLLKTWLSVNKDDFLRFQKCTWSRLKCILYKNHTSLNRGLRNFKYDPKDLGPMVVMGVTTVHRKIEGAIMTKQPTDSNWFPWTRLLSWHMYIILNSLISKGFWQIGIFFAFTAQ